MNEEQQLPASRKEAIQTLSKFYYTGKPCRKGHLSKRETIKGTCIECRSENAKKHFSMVREKFKGAK